MYLGQSPKLYTTIPMKPMNLTRRRRYIFLDYEVLTLISVKKLQKLATKLFVFIDVSKHKSIPIDFVKKVQPLGNSMKWVIASSEDYAGHLNYQLAFVMGRLHQKVGFDVEFFILSDDPEFDALVGFINATRRKCRRITRYPDEGQSNSEKYPYDVEQHDEIDRVSGDTPFSFMQNSDEELQDVMVDDQIIERSRADTVKRLIVANDRPKHISELREFINLHNQEGSIGDHVDRIIQRMKKKNEIEIKKGMVIYNF